MNASGLPDPQHYSTARDLYLLASALIRDFPEQYAQYYSLREYRYNGITQPNRNRLLWLDNTVDGMKTGFTEAAGYCLVASSQARPAAPAVGAARLDLRDRCARRSRRSCSTGDSSSSTRCASTRAARR